MQKQKPTSEKVIRFWRRRGGWAHGVLLKAGRKWARIETLAVFYNPDTKRWTPKRQRVAMADVREVAQ